MNKFCEYSYILLSKLVLICRVIVFGGGQGFIQEKLVASHRYFGRHKHVNSHIYKPVELRDYDLKSIINTQSMILENLYCSLFFYPSTTCPAILLSVHNGFYPSK